MTIYRNYTDRLVALSHRLIDPAEARALIRRDICSDFLFITGPPDVWELFEETDALRLESLFGEGRPKSMLKSCATIRIDFLNPTSGYLDLLLPLGIRYHALDAECNLQDSMTKLGIPPFNSTITCTTANDHPMSAYRRTIIILNQDQAGNDTGARSTGREFFNTDVFAQLEDLMEESLREEIETMRFE